MTSEDRQRSLSDQVAQHTSLTDIRVSTLEAELENAAPSGPVKTEASIAGTEFTRSSRVVAYALSYGFAARDQDNTQVWKVRFTLVLTFRMYGGDLSDEALKAFGGREIIQIAHPYARELIHSMTGRMRVPAFLLEVLPPGP